MMTHCENREMFTGQFTIDKTFTPLQTVMPQPSGADQGTAGDPVGIG